MALRMLASTTSRATEIELEVAAGGEEGEVSFELLLEVVTATAEQRSVSQVEAELAAVDPNEVEHGAFGLAVLRGAVLGPSC